MAVLMVIVGVVAGLVVTGKEGDRKVQKLTDRGGPDTRSMRQLWGVGVASRPKGDPTSIVLPWMVTVVTIRCAAVSVAGRAQPP